MRQSMYAEEVMLSENELVPNNVKVLSLNTYKFKLQTLSTQTTDKVILNAISTLLLVIEDAYNVDMYRFSFKILSLTLGKEIDNLEKMVQFNG